MEVKKINESSQLKVLQSKLSEKFAEKGQYQAEEVAYQRMIVERESIAKALLSKTDPSIEGRPLEETEIFNFIVNLEKEKKINNEKLDLFRKTMQAEELVLQNEMQRLKSTLSGIEENERLTRSQLNDKLSKISNSQQKIKATNSIMKEMEDLAVTIGILDAEIQNYKASIDEEANHANIEQLKSRFNELEEKGQSIQNEMAMLNLQGGTRAKLGIKKSELEGKIQELNRLKETISSNSAVLIAGSFEMDALELKIIQNIAKQENNIKSLRSSHQSKSNQLSGLNSKISMIQNSIVQKSSELDAKMKSIKAACGDEEYDVVKARIESEAESHRK